MDDRPTDEDRPAWTAREPGTGRATGLVVAAWALALVALGTGAWIVAGPLGIAAGFAASQRGDRRGGPAMVAAGIATVLGAVVVELFT